MESITLSLPKVQAGRLSLTISKKLLVKLGETLTVFFIFAGSFVWLFI